MLEDLQYIFNQIYINNIPAPIQHFFSDVYLFCLHKDLNDASKLRPIGIPTAIRRIIARHVAQTFKSKFAEYLLPYNFAVGIPNGGVTIINAIQLGIEKYITNRETVGQLPTRAAVFFDLLNMFNNISRSIFWYHCYIIPQIAPTYQIIPIVILATYSINGSTENGKSST